MNNKIMEEAVKCDYDVYNFSDLVDYLQIIKNSGMNLYIEYQGKKFYALLDDENSCYKKMYGMSKEEYQIARDKKLGRYDYDEEKKIAEAQAKVSSWIERGHKVIYPQMSDEWDAIVKEKAADFLHGFDLENALTVMECLEQGGSVKQADDLIYAAGHSSNSVPGTIELIVNFSKRGLEFVEESALSDFFYGSYKLLDEIDERNRKFETELESGQLGGGN